MADILGHVQDAYYFEVPRAFAPAREVTLGEAKVPEDQTVGKWFIPQPLAMMEVRTDHGHLSVTKSSGFAFSKFMVLEVVAALLLAAVFIPLARRIKQGNEPRGRFWNFFEVLLTFIRDQVARPAIGKHDADRFLPFLWTMFFFVLSCNVIGMFPWSGTATSELAVTAVLAGLTFATVIFAGVSKLGPAGFLKAQVPHMDLPGPLGVVLKPMIFVIEIVGICIKHVVLSVRLLANMFAGHVVLAVIIGFIGATVGSALWYGIMPAAVLGAVALSLLELFVAFLQAYIFVFLSALFIGMAVHPH